MTCASDEPIFNIVSALAAEEVRVVSAKKLHTDKSLEIDGICKTLRISHSTYYRDVRMSPAFAEVTNCSTGKCRFGVHFLGLSRNV
ncbi:MAG: hypothetical protein IID46_02390 [Planctomycetes bacterium]|nr:hypothetical protein [Planctomycetota bacterium]